MRLIFLGDVVGKTGREAIARHLPPMRERYRPDVILDRAQKDLGKYAEAMLAFPFQLHDLMDEFRARDGQWNYSFDPETIFHGDGGVNQGVLLESLNLAAIWSLPKPSSARTSHTRSKRFAMEFVRPSTRRCRSRTCRFVRW